jgi:hypothetical protein
MGEMRTDLDVLDLRGRRQVDHGHGPVGLVRDEPELAVAGDRGAVGVAADLDEASRAGGSVDHRRVVGEVERREERLAVA